jgi:hypothetical protein
MPPRPRSTKRNRYSRPPQASDKDHAIRQGRPFNRQRLEYCDCGKLAVTVLQVRVGTDPQYIIRLPLCPACLKLEQDLRRDLPHNVT